MKVNELRIGNLVNIEFDELHLCEITHIDRFNCSIVIIDDGEEFVSFTQDYCIDDIKPIPLTEEWIKSVNLNAYHGISIHNSIFSGIITIRRNKTLNMYEFYIGRFSIRFINYIHEVQNLFFALVGEELKIK